MTWKKRFTALTNSHKKIPFWAICLQLFLLAFIPRATNLDAYVASDEAKWILRSAHFYSALISGNLGDASSQVATPEVDVLAPAVTTMWTGAAGLWAKYEASDVNLSLLEFLAALPYKNSDEMPLDYYPWARFPTVLITSLFVVAFYALLRKLLENEIIPLIAAILLALDPFFLNHSRVIHHDALVTVFVTLTLLLTMRFLQKNRLIRLILAGLTFGLAVLTKPTALILAPFIGLMFLWKIYKTKNWKLLIWGVLLGVIGLITFIAIWPALWSDPIGTLSRLMQTSLTGAVGNDQEELPLVPALIPGRLPELGFLFYPTNFLLRWGILPTIGLILAIVTWQRRKNTLSLQGRAVLLWLALFATILILALAPLGTRDIRYFMPAWPALLAIAAFGLTVIKGLAKPAIIAMLSILLLVPYYPYYVTYFNPLVLGPYLAPQLIKFGGGVGLDQAALYLNTTSAPENKTVASYTLEAIRPYFAGNATEHKSGNFADYTVNYIRQIQNQHPSIENLTYFAARHPDHTVTINGVDYAYVYRLPPPQLVKDVSFDKVTLTAQTLDARTAEPDSQHQLTLLWDAPPEAANTQVKIELRDSAAIVWSEAGGPLISPEGPSTVEGHYLLNFPPDMPRGEYELWVTAGQNVAPQKVTKIGVYNLTPPQNINHPVQANFNNSIEMAGFDINTFTPPPGKPLQLKLYWHALQNMARTYTNFIHLIDSNGNPVAQADIVPGNGLAPTDTWQPNEWLIDTVTLNLPANLPSGKYDILLGWYYWETLERLPLINRGNDFLYLTSVEIQ